LGFIFAQVVFSAVVGLVIIGFMGISVASLISNSRSKTPLMATSTEDHRSAVNVAPASPENPPQKRPGTAR